MVNIKKIKIGQILSKKEFHKDLTKDLDKIFILTDVLTRVCNVKNTREVKLEITNKRTMQVEKVQPEELYILHPGADQKAYVDELNSYISGRSITSTNLVMGIDSCITTTTSGTGIAYFDTTSGTANYAYGDNTGNISWSIGVVDEHEGDIRMIWNPLRDINTHELALAMPWIIDPWIDPDNPIRYKPFFRHFLFEDDEEFEHLFNDEETD